MTSPATPTARPCCASPARPAPAPPPAAPPSPAPAPSDPLLHQLAASRHEHVPANHASTWLFPGRNAGQPADYRAMFTQLRDLGLPMRTGRVSALRQLVLQVPAP